MNRFRNKNGCPLEARGIGGWSLGILCVVFCAAAEVFSEETGMATRSRLSAAPFRMGFSRQIFLDKNPNDARAAVLAWTLAIAREKGISADREARFYDSTQEVIQAMRAAEIDGVTLLLDEYAAMISELDTNRLLRPEAGGSFSERYVALAREEGGMKKLGDLRGCKLIIHESDRLSLAVPWLDVLLLREGINGASTGFFGDVARERKLSSAVLRVFFGQWDACIVTLNGFHGMAELNPQVGSRLRVIETSPPFIPTIFSFRKGFQSMGNERVFDAILHLNESVAGRQILQVFQADRMARVSPNQLESSLELLAERERLLREISGPQKTPGGGSL